VTLICAFAGRNAVHKRATTSEQEEIRVFIDPR
jgi:hypothetical protein